MRERTVTYIQPSFLPRIPLAEILINGVIMCVCFTGANRLAFLSTWQNTLFKLKSDQDGSHSNLINTPLEESFDDIVKNDIPLLAE